MKYKLVQMVVETPTCLAIANKLSSEEERADIEALVAADPQCGDLIRGSGGFRKVTVARKGLGKSGGAAVVDIWRNERFPVFLTMALPKNEKENLSMAAGNALQNAPIVFSRPTGGSMKTHQQMMALTTLRRFLLGSMKDSRHMCPTMLT